MRDRASKHRHDAGGAIRGRAFIDDASVLASKARPFLQGHASSDRQILKWADTYIARMGSVDVKSFVEWIHLRERVRDVT